MAWLAGRRQLANLIQRLQATSRSAGSDFGTCETGWTEGRDRVCWDNTLALLRGIQATASAQGVPLAILASPMQWQAETGVADPRNWIDAARYQQVLADFARGQGIVFIDPLPAIRRQAGEQSLFLNVGHPDETGQRIMAQELYTGLVQAGVLP